MMVMDAYCKTLIQNMPPTSTPMQSIDIILDGGMFNGSYLAGAMQFISEFEKQGKIKVKRVSGCSIGAIVALLYFMDALDLMPMLYTIAVTDFRTPPHHMSSLLTLKTHIMHRIPDSLCAKVRKRLYVCYYEKHKKRVRFEYADIDDLIDSVLRSCFIPYIVTGEMLWHGKYMDGITPYIFKPTSHRRRHILYLDLFGLDKVGLFFNVKNEELNTHRILAGLLDIHSFFMKQSDTSMCSYMHTWGILNWARHQLKRGIELILVTLVWLLSIVSKYTSTTSINDSIVFRIGSLIFRECAMNMIQCYCV